MSSPAAPTFKFAKMNERKVKDAIERAVKTSQVNVKAAGSGAPASARMKPVSEVGLASTCPSKLRVPPVRRCERGGALVASFQDQPANMWTVINSRLPIAIRLSFIAACLLVPIAILAVLFVEQSTKDISFAKKEIAGAAYLDGVWANLIKSERSEAPQAIPGQAEFDQLFDTAKPASEFETAKGPAARVDAGKALISAVADGSNITLDPDLDSFYVGDATTVRIPGIITASEALKVALQEKDTDERLIHIAFAVSCLKSSADDAVSSLQSAIAGNATGEAGRALSKPADDLKAAAIAALELADKALSRQPVPGLDEARSKLVAQADLTWRAADGELSRLLQARVDSLLHSLIVKLGLVIASLVAAVAMLAAVARGITGPLARLTAAMQELANGNFSVALPGLDRKDEIGRIAASVSAFKVRAAEKARVEAEEARRRHAREAEFR